MPDIERRACCRTHDAGDLGRFVTVFAPRFLIAEDQVISAGVLRIDFLVKNCLLAQMGQSGPEEIVARRTGPHTIESLLIGKIGPNVGETDDIAMFHERFRESSFSLDNSHTRKITLRCEIDSDVGGRLLRDRRDRDHLRRAAEKLGTLESRVGGSNPEVRFEDFDIACAASRITLE